MNVLGIKILPKAGSLGAWLKRMGEAFSVQSAWETVNKAILKSAVRALIARGLFCQKAQN